MKMFNNNKLTILAMLALFILCVVACKKNDSVPAKPGSSTVGIFLTDDPSPIFDNVFIDIQKVEIKAQDDSVARIEDQHQVENDSADLSGSAGVGWIDLNVTPGQYDLLKFRNGLDTALGSTDFLSTRHMKKIRITLGTNNIGILNGVSVPLVIKGKDKNILVLTLEESLLSSTNGKFQLSVDMDASRSVSKNGNEYDLLPEVKSFDRAESGSIEGKVLPVDAMAFVYAINGTDTASARPGKEGEFKIVGVKDATYKLLFQATANNYIDSSIQVIVAGKKSISVPTVVLRK
jgi:hypothetical protein